MHSLVLLLNCMNLLLHTEGWEEQFYLLKCFIYEGVYEIEVRIACFRNFTSVDVTIILQRGWKHGPIVCICFAGSAFSQTN